MPMRFIGTPVTFLGGFLTRGERGSELRAGLFSELALDISDNDRVEAYNRNGVVVARAAVSHRIPEGTCLMYHAKDRHCSVTCKQVSKRPSTCGSTTSRYYQRVVRRCVAPDPGDLRDQPAPTTGTNVWSSMSLEHQDHTVGGSPAHLRRATTLVLGRDRVRVAPSGKLDIATADQVVEQVRELLDAGFEHIPIDLREVSFMDCSALRIIVVAHARAGKQGGRFLVIRAATEDVLA